MSLHDLQSTVRTDRLQAVRGVRQALGSVDNGDELKHVAAQLLAALGREQDAVVAAALLSTLGLVAASPLISTSLLFNSAAASVPTASSVPVQCAFLTAATALCQCCSKDKGAAAYAAQCLAQLQVLAAGSRPWHVLPGDRRTIPALIHLLARCTAQDVAPTTIEAVDPFVSHPEWRVRLAAYHALQRFACSAELSSQVTVCGCVAGWHAMNQASLTVSCYPSDNTDH